MLTAAEIIVSLCALLVMFFTVSIAGSLTMIANALKAQNDHYEIGVAKVEPARVERVDDRLGPDEARSTDVDAPPRDPGKKTSW